MSTLNLLPYEIKRYEILPKIDKASRIILRLVLLNQQFPRYIDHETEEEVAQYSPSFISLFHDTWLLAEDFITYLTKNNNLAGIKWAKNNGYNFGFATTGYAAENGNIELLQWLKQNDCVWSASTASYAARAGKDTLKYVLDRGCPVTTDVCSEAADLECLVYIREVANIWQNASDMGYYYAKRGQLDCLKYAYQHGCYFGASVAAVAATNGHLDILKWLHEIKYQYWGDVYRCAAEDYQLEVLKWAYDVIKLRMNEHAIVGAIIGSNLDAMKWLRVRGAPWKPWLCSRRHSDRHYECLQYAMNDGCSWDEESVVSAAHQGHTRCLEYFCNEGAALSKEVFFEALRGGNLKCIKYIYQRAPSYLTKDTIIGHIIYFDNVEGFSWAVSTLDIAVDPNFLKAIVRSGAVKILDWCYVRGVALDSTQIYVWADQGRHLNILRWMRRVCRLISPKEYTRWQEKDNYISEAVKKHLLGK